MKHLSIIFLAFLFHFTYQFEMKDIKLESIKGEKMKVAKGGPNIAEQLQELIVKVHFREKYMKKKGIE